jgi:hypothetical protein
VGVLREVEDGVGAAHGVRGAVVGPGGLLGGVEGAKPHADAVPARVADLGGVLAPRPAPHAAVLGVRVAVHGTERARSCGRSRGMAQELASTEGGGMCVMLEGQGRRARRGFKRGERKTWERDI